MPISTPGKALSTKTLIHLIWRFRWHYLLPLTVHASTNSISLPIKKTICLLRMGCLGWIFLGGRSRHYTEPPILPKSPNISLPVRIYYQTPFNKQINKLLTDLPNKSPYQPVPLIPLCKSPLPICSTTKIYLLNL